MQCGRAAFKPGGAKGQSGEGQRSFIGAGSQGSDAWRTPGGDQCGKVVMANVSRGNLYAPACNSKKWEPRIKEYVNRVQLWKQFHLTFLRSYPDTEHNCVEDFG